MTRKPPQDPPHNNDAELTGRAAIEEIDRRLGGLLGPLAEGLAKVVDAAEKAQAQAGAATVETGRGGLRVRSGLSVRVGGHPLRGDGAQAATPAGRDPAQPMATSDAAAQHDPAVAGKTDRQFQKRHFDAEEPHYDVYETVSDWSLTADMPGAAHQDLSLALENRMLTIETAATAPRRWRLTVDAPDWLTAEALSHSLNNGVLEITATRGAAS